MFTTQNGHEAVLGERLDQCCFYQLLPLNYVHYLYQSIFLKIPDAKKWVAPTLTPLCTWR